MHRRFFRTYALAGVVFALPFALNAAFVIRAGETMTYAEVAARQQRERALYGSAFNQNNFRYKLELVRQRQPAVIALGSSRVMTFREESFRTSFVNCGGAMNSLHEGRQFLERLFEFHRPEAVIMGLDFWWFNAATPQPAPGPKGASTGDDLSFEKLANPTCYLLDGRAPLDRFLDILWRGERSSPLLAMESLGLQAILRAEGFRPDGSRLYAGAASGADPAFWDYRFEDTLTRINHGRRQFQYARTMDPALLAEFEAIVDLCRRHGVRLALFISPLSDAARQAMDARGEDYAYIEEFRRWAASRPEPIPDYHDLASLGSTDCENVDGFHGGETIYLRTLLRLIERPELAWLAPYVDDGRSRQALERSAGRALARFNEDGYRFEEADFLGIGCPKDAGLAPASGGAPPVTWREKGAS